MPPRRDVEERLQELRRAEAAEIEELRRAIALNSKLTETSTKATELMMVELQSVKKRMSDVYSAINGGIGPDDLGYKGVIQQLVNRVQKNEQDVLEINTERATVKRFVAGGIVSAIVAVVAAIFNAFVTLYRKP